MKNVFFNANKYTNLYLYNTIKTLIIFNKIYSSTGKW
jgi:hypothetical protein